MAWNKWRILVATAVTLVAIVVVGALFLFFSTHKHQGLRELYVGKDSVYVYVADTEARRELGLSGRESMPTDEGMLFVFPIEGKFSFWMKDMKFPIDILWLANDGSIIYIQKSVSPDTYPQEFAPETGLARYVLELPSGYSQEHNLDIGDKVSI